MSRKALSFLPNAYPRAGRAAYTRLRFVPTKADRPYGAFPGARPDTVPEPGPPPGPARDRLGTVLRRALPWLGMLAAPLLLGAIALAPVPRPEDAQPSPTPIAPMTDVYAKVAPSVVQIRTAKPDGTLLDAGSGVGIVTGLVSPNGQPQFSGVGFAVNIETASGALGIPPD